jgi:hypothetical protein
MEPCFGKSYDVIMRSSNRREIKIVSFGSQPPNILIIAN